MHKLVRVSIAISCLLSILPLVFSCSEKDRPTRPKDDFAGKEWTILCYVASDYDGGISGIMPVAGISSSPDVDLLFLQDTYTEMAKLYYINEDEEAILKEDIGEISMGEKETLSYFLTYAKENYPARKYIIALYGHGGGWGGACNDFTAEFTVLRMDEIQQALSEAGGVDLVLHISCSMGAFESAYELRNCADVCIAHEYLSFFGFWRYIMPDIFQALNDDPHISNDELGARIAELIWDDRIRWENEGYDKDLTISAVKTDRLSELKDEIDLLFQEP